MENWQSDYLKGNKQTVFVALNPTEEANKNQAVFSTRITFWQILKDAGFIENLPENLITVQYASVVFNMNTNLGFTDLVEDCFEKKSNNVKVTHAHVKTLLTNVRKTGATKLVLLGHKVTGHFVKERNELKDNWIQLNKNKIDWNDNKGKKIHVVDYGLLGVINLDGNEIQVFVMPFPETRPLKDKYKFYQKIL